MANERPTMLDVAKSVAGDQLAGLISEITTSAPEFSLFPGRIIPGTSYQTRYRTALPTAAFRSANAGQEATKSTYELRTAQCYLLSNRIEADKAVADVWQGGPAVYQAEEAAGVLQAAIIKFGSQVYYGNPSTTDKGFPGLQYQYDSSTMEVDATGTGSACSSVYAVRFGLQDVTGIFGGNMAMGMDDWRIGDANDSDGNPFTAYISGLNSWLGVQTTTKTSIARIKNIHASDSGKTLDDDFIYKLLEKFPAGMGPDVLLMNRRSLRQLRESRTATNATGAPAPMPTEVEGVRIVVTDSLVNTEVAA